MKHFSKLLLAGVSLCFLASCKKNNQPDKTTLLTSGKWRYIAHTSTNKSTGASYDNYTSLPACAKDNEFIFTATGVHEYTEGATKCNTADPQVIYFASWKFINNETGIEVMAGSSRLEYTIITLTASELSLEASNATITDRIKLIH